MTAIVTGAAGGIGAAFARAFAAQGRRLLLVDVRQQALHQLAEMLASDGVEVEPLVFKRRVVEVGLEQAGFAQIRSGLKLDETIVVRGAIFVDNEWRQ